MAVYTIPMANMKTLENRVKKLNGRAKRMKCDLIEMKKIDKQIREITQGKEKILIEYVTVEIDGESPKLNDWKFMAVLQHSHETGTVVRSITGEELPTRFYNADTSCDHCNTKRYRKDTYVVMNEKTGDYKKVGRTCLKDFMGHAEVEQIAKYYGLLIGFDEMIDELDSYKMSNGSMDDRYYPIEKYLNYVTETIKDKGYTSKSKADSSIGIFPTCDIAFERMEGMGLERIEPTEESEELAERALQWIREKDVVGLGEYWHNLKTICNSDYIGIRDMGFVTSLISVYNKHMEIERSRNREVKNSEHVGEVGKRQDFTLTVTKIVPMDSYYGMTYIHIFTDTQGNIFKWGTNKSLEEEVTYVIKGTVKEHGEYREVKQTSITRCKVLQKLEE